MLKNQSNLRSLALRCVAVFAAGILALASRAVAEVPQQINHQGVVSVDSERFDGTGAFRFAIVDPDKGVNLWTNDGTHEGEVGGVPDNAVSLPVADGIYSIGLGDTSLANMTPIPSSVFNDDNAVLRIWFDDGDVNGNQQLTPDHKLTTAPYSFRLPNIFAEGSNVGIGTTMPEAKLDVDGEIKGFGIVPIGSIIAWHKSFANTPGLPSGWLECNGQTVNDLESPYDGQTLPDLNSARRFLRGGSSSGTLEADASQGHKHNVDTNAGTELKASGGGVNAWGSSVLARDHSDAGRYKAQNPITDGINGTPRTANETRPVNMSVAWIMRVK